MGSDMEIYQETTMNITWFGHAAFALEADGVTVLVDPFLTGNPANVVDAATVKADTIVLTHAHNDHVGDTIDIAKRTGATVIATAELASWCEKQGVADAVAGNHGGTIPFEGGSTKFVPAWHTSSYSTGDADVAPGVPAGQVIRFGGKTIYFAGDTCLFLDMQLIADEELDFAVLPIGDKFTMGPKDAVRAAQFLRAGTIIPCHYNTFPALNQDVDAFKTAVETETASKVLILTSGESTGI